MGLPKEIAELIERFERNREAYKSGQYNEMQLRQEFLDPFFGALGWDMNNQQGYAEAYKDVIHEDSIKVGADTKAPDYCFRTGGTRKFFLEAKKPSVHIKEDISPAFQLRRYAWSAKLPLSILSDFEEFAIYDTRIKPEKMDKASSARIHYFTYQDYEKNWDLITSVFSREAVLKGSFDKYAEKSRLKKGTATVDDAFLTEIEDWRDMLAKNIALRNADLSTRELNFAVQRTIDRIVFLRICEDRGIEEYGRLQVQLNGTNVYKRLVQLFSQADDRYNSGLFHFQREKDRHEDPDKLTPNIAIDDKPLKDIINRLYYPESPYEFSVLSADILGQVYEQFLGKVIRLTAGHQAKVEEKPEVRKAGGVYYTPKYIVDYIVKNTVGKLLGGGDRGSEIEIGGRGSGVGIDNTNIQGPGSLAGSDELNNGGIPPDKNVSEGRTLWVDQSNAESSSLNPRQHSGGAQSEIEKRISSPRVDSPGIAGGIGNTSDAGKSIGISTETKSGESMGSIAAGRASDKRSSAFSPTPDRRPLTPKDASRLKILDPACGSGSFLLGAYQYLLDWHRDWYVSDDPKKWCLAKNPPLYQAQGGDYHLTTSEKKRILLNNIYGVDIDSQAVEVTKLSLFLKVLEGENNQTLANQLKMFHERALPDLGDNIKCGNSLVGPDFYQQQTMLDDEERYRVNVFDWKKEFPQVFSPSPREGEGRGEGGFDAVIGNPPYVRQELLGELKDYFQQHYETYHGVADLYVYFVEKGVSLLKQGGHFGIIVANKWMKVNYGEPLRQWMKTQNLVEIVDFGDLPVFKGATTYTCILHLSRNHQQDVFNAVHVKTLDFTSLTDYVGEHSSVVSRSALDDLGWSLADDKTQKLLTKLKTTGRPLVEYVDGKIYYGVKTGFNEAFVVDRKTRKELISEDKKSAEVIKPFLAGRDIRRYQTPGSDKFVIFTRRGVDIKKYPAIEKYLRTFKDRLMPKPKDWKGKEWTGRKPGPYQWYEIQDTVDYYAEFEKPKILWPGISSEVTAFALDENGYYGNDNNQLIITGDKYLLGVLNSKLSKYILTHICDKVQGGFYRLKITYIEQLPIRPLNVAAPADKGLHEKMVSLVDQMLSLNKQLPEAKTDHEKTALQRQIDATDQQIDKLVYGLYGLTEEEIKIVEGH